MKFILAIRLFVLVLFALTYFSISINAQKDVTLTLKEKISIVDKVSNLLNENYVFPDVASKIEKHLKSQLSKGVFNSITNQTEFAEKLTSEMQSISNDKHMRCFPSNGRSIKRPKRNSPLIGNEYDQLKNEQNFSFCRVGIINNNVGILDIYGFPGSKSAEKTVDEAMKVVSSVSALIIDLRRNGGGSPDLIRYICSYFFDKPTHINSIYWRTTNKTVDFITSEEVAGKKLTNIPVYVLTSSFTFSGGEEFAYNFQTQKRGILIGEVTGGGANPGDVFSISDDFEIFIPTGRAINPITKTNWEGVGVRPDIEVESSKAFEIALSKISSYWIEPFTKMAFVLIPKGTFYMGNPNKDSNYPSFEKQHLVTISNDFWLGLMEVTQEQWNKVMGDNEIHPEKPNPFRTDDPKYPVVSVSYYDVETFLHKLEELSPGNKFRLPTEAEWEYACRAGTTTSYSFGNSITLEQVNFKNKKTGDYIAIGKIGGHPAVVGSYPPNPWGLYDMHGNVWEWVSDWYAPYPTEHVIDPKGPTNGNDKVMRGGSWYFGVDHAQSFFRGTHPPQLWGFSMGFRVVYEKTSKKK